MAGKKAQGDAPSVSPEERARIAKSARQVAAYVNFLRWTANFRRDEITRHPQHDRVMLLSPMQSGRFSFALEGDTLMLGVQGFEANWMSHMPFVGAYLSDRLYLAVDSVACMDARLPDIAIGIFVDEPRKRALMSQAKYLQLLRVNASEGRVVDVGRAIGLGVPLKHKDVVEQLVISAREKLRQQDIGRFF